MKRLVLVLIVLMVALPAFGEKPNLKLPFPGGESWQITTGYGGSNYHQNKDYYALDFNLSGDSDLGKSILATAEGDVVFADWYNEYGWTVDINHGDGYVSRYAHLQEKPGVSGHICQGNQIGRCGMTGGTSTGPHLHFALYHNGQAEIPEPMSGYTNFTEGVWYTSDNYGIPVAGHYQNGTIHQAIMDCYNQFSSLVGQPFDNGGGVYVHRWYSQNGSTFVELQDFYNQTTNEYYAIIFNPRLNQAFLLKGGFRWYYMSEVDGPAFFGPPMSNEQPISYYPFVNGSFDYNATPNVTYIGQEFETGKMMLWRSGSSFYVESIGGTGGGEIVEIALLPGDGQTLTLLAYAQSSTATYLNWNPITGAVSYEAYQDGSFVGSTSATELTVSNLSPNTAYTFQVKAVAAKSGVTFLKPITPRCNRLLTKSS